MKITFLPDLAAMASLLGILYFLRRRHPQEGVELWLLGLLFIFVEALSHAFYTAKGALHIPLHAIALDSYLFGGLIFLKAAARGLIPQRQKLIYLAVYAPALSAMETVYAFDGRRVGVFQAIAVLGSLIGVAAPFVLMRSTRLGRTWWLVVGQIALWGPTWIFASQRMFRDAAYYPLFVLYLAVALVFWINLPRGSLGRIAISVGFTLWAFVFLTHSWVSSHPQYAEFAAQVWDWQKFLVTIGMLLVLLERQVESNAWFALHDQLTGLPNRRHFEQQLDVAIEQAARSESRVAVVMVDLNGFKMVNDRCGHATGDRLLKQIAEDLSQVIRDVDTLARLGGDEFIIVAADLPIDIPVAQITEMTTNRVLEALERPFESADEIFNVGGSVGVAIYPDDAVDTTALRRLADQRCTSASAGYRCYRCEGERASATARVPCAGGAPFVMCIPASPWASCWSAQKSFVSDQRESRAEARSAVREGPGSGSDGRAIALDLGVEVKECVEAHAELGFDLLSAALEDMHGDLGLIAVFELDGSVTNADDLVGGEKPHSIDQS